LKERLHYRVGKLSGGEQQRVALARALVLKPAVLLADEPTGNLDVVNSEQVHALLLELNQELSMTLVVVTHNQKLAERMSRRVTITAGQLETIA
jgi:lipoprotein-releasing system ATP-binding protein